MTKLSKTFFLGILIFLFFVQSNLGLENNNWTPQKIIELEEDGGSIIHFQNGIILKSEFVNMHYIGVIKTNLKFPYLIFKVNTCSRCDENYHIVILNRVDDKLVQVNRTDYPTSPGQIYSFGPDSTLIYKVRLFYGNCLRDHKEGAFWFTSAKNSNGDWEDSIQASEIINDKLLSYYLKQPLPDINDTLLFVKAGNCVEVPGQKITEGP